jgi:hypothetical protein
LTSLESEDTNMLPPGAAPDLSTIDFPPVPEKLPLKMEFLFNYTIHLSKDGPPMQVGEVPAGYLSIISEHGTKITGPKINGCVAAYGQDYMTVRQDGVAHHEVRHIILTNDGAKIAFHYDGRSDWGPNGYQEAVSGKIPEGLRIRCAPHILSSHPNYLWVNRLQCIEVGEVYPSKGYATFDVYSLI